MHRNTRFYSLLASAITALCVLNPHIASAEKAPLIQYVNANETMITLNPGEAKLTAVHFWATWCTPCVAELPEVDAAQQTYGKAGLKVVAISMDGNLKKVTDFYKKHNINALDALDDYKAVSFNNLKLLGLPTTVFIDAKGEIIGRVDGPMHWNESPNKEFIEKQLK